MYRLQNVCQVNSLKYKIALQFGFNRAFEDTHKHWIRSIATNLRARVPVFLTSKSESKGGWALTSPT